MRESVENPPILFAGEQAELIEPVGRIARSLRANKSDFHRSGRMACVKSEACLKHLAGLNISRFYQKSAKTDCGGCILSALSSYFGAAQNQMLNSRQNAFCLAENYLKRARSDCGNGGCRSAGFIAAYRMLRISFGAKLAATRLFASVLSSELVKKNSHEIKLFFSQIFDS